MQYGNNWMEYYNTSEDVSLNRTMQYGNSWVSDKFARGVIV